MKALVVFESEFGNTEQVARAIVAGLAETCSVEAVEATQAPEELASGIDLLLLGGPTHAFSMSRARTRDDAARQGGRSVRRGLREWLAELVPVRGGPQPQVVTFDTRVAKARRLPGSAAKSASRKARGRGFTSVEQGESFYVADVNGPLLDGEVERAENWGRSLARRARHERTG